jgi:hypothetical protein
MFPQPRTGSAPLYDAAGAERRVAKLRRERRRRAEGSEEFHRLRSMYVPAQQYIEPP